MMTYFNPEIYNENNLSEEDRNEIHFYREMFDNAILNAKDHLMLDDDTIMDKIKEEIIDTYIQSLRMNVDCMFQDIIVSYIER